MRFKKLTALFCVLLMIFTVIPQISYAESITALDLSENKTRFTSLNESGTLVVYGLTGAETERARSGLLDNSSLQFSSSDPAVMSVDAQGRYTVKGEGIAIVTVKYESVESGMVIYCEDSANLYTVASDTTNVETAADEFRGKTDVLKLTKDMYNPKLSDTTYVMGGWFYDDAVATNGTIAYKFGPRGATAERILWGAYLENRTNLNANVMSCSDVSNTVSVSKSSRIKGWHQFFTVIQRVDNTTHYMTFFDGELVLKGTTSTAVSPYYIDGMSKTLSQEVYIAPYSLASFAVSSTGIEDGSGNVPVDAECKIDFNRTLTDVSSLEFELTDKVYNETIGLSDVTIDGNSVKAKPTYELVNDREYSLKISGTAVSAESTFAPSATADVDESISFTTAKADLYAENLSVSHSGTVNFSADIVNNSGDTDVWLIAAQYTAGGEQKSIAAEKTSSTSSGAATPISSIPVAGGATASEGYVWTGLNALEAKSLAEPAVSGTVKRDSADAGSQTSSYADVMYSAESGLVEVHGYSASGRSGLPVLVRIIKPGKDYTKATANNVNDIYARVEQVSTAGGRFDYKFALDGDAGEYKAIVNIPYEAAIEDEIKFASREDVYAYMGYVQNPKTHPETNDPEKVFEKARLVLDMNYTKFDKLTHKSIIYSMMSTAEDFETFKAFSDFFAEAVDTVYALENNDTATIEAKKSEWGIGDLSVWAKYKKYSADDKKELHKAVLDAGFKSYKELCDKFAEHIILKELKAVNNYTAIYPILEETADCFAADSPTLDFDTYEDLSKSYKEKAMKEFSKELEDLSSKSDIIEKFNDAVSDAEDEESNEKKGSNKTTPSYTGGLKGGSGSSKTENINGTYTTGTETIMGSETPEWVLKEKELKTRKVFDDIDSVPWAEDAIRELYNRGVIAGKAERVFAPNDYLTKEELVKMLLVAMKLENTEAAPVDMWDINRSQWYAPYVDASVALGIVEGSGDGSFGIGSLVNREEICVIAQRAAQAGGIFLDDEFTISSFADEQQISSWAVDSVRQMRESFIITGVGGNYFEPKSLVTRAQAAKIIYGILAYSEI